MLFETFTKTLRTDMKLREGYEKKKTSTVPTKRKIEKNIVWLNDLGEIMFLVINSWRYFNYLVIK